MSTSDIQKVQQAQLHSTLWDMANNLRGSMEAYEFKSYILGLIFYRYLSEKVEKNAYLLLKMIIFLLKISMLIMMKI